MIMGYRLVQAVTVVTFGRLGDMFGRVKIYNAGFAVFTVASILLSFDPFVGGHGAQWLIGWRMLQALGGSMLLANSAAILTDAFPSDKRGFALGINQVAGLSGMFIGLVAGGLLAAVDWRAGSMCPSAYSGRCGPIASSARPVLDRVAGSTGGATSPSPSGSAPS
jgi:MFS family permease